jgi:hypothetical protein
LDAGKRTPAPTSYHRPPPRSPATGSRAITLSA